MTYQGKYVTSQINLDGHCSNMFPDEMAVIVAAGKPPVAKCDAYGLAIH